MEIFKDFPFIDFETFTTLAFDVVKDTESGDYNLQLVFMGVEDDRTIGGGMIYRTAIYVESLQEIAEKITAIDDTGMFDNLDMMAQGHILTEESELIERINWIQYSSNLDMTKANLITHSNYPTTIQ